MKTKTFTFILSLVFVLSIFSYANVKNIAHRGCSSIAPENTYSAWVKAIEAGADYYELDIQLSSDDSLVIMHDDTIDRTTDGSGLVSSLTYAQLRAVDAGSWFSSDVYWGENSNIF